VNGVLKEIGRDDLRRWHVWKLLIAPIYNWCHTLHQNVTADTFFAKIIHTWVIKHQHHLSLWWHICSKLLVKNKSLNFCARLCFEILRARLTEGNALRAYYFLGFRLLFLSGVQLRGLLLWKILSFTKRRGKLLWRLLLVLGIPHDRLLLFDLQAISGIIALHFYFII
jgi:hypothetical protein